TSGMAAFEQVVVLIGLGLFVRGGRGLWFIIALGLALMALPVPGSRGVFLVVIIGAALMMCASYISGFISAKTFATTLLTMGVLALISILLQAEAWQGLSQRHYASTDEQSRAISVFSNAFEYFDTAGAFGFGSGATSNAARALVPTAIPFAWLPFGTAFEDES